MHVKCSKSFFRHMELEYLGNIISKVSIKVDPMKIEYMRNWSFPKYLNTLHGLLRLTWYYHKFIKYYEKIVGMLTSFLKKNFQLVTCLWRIISLTKGYHVFYPNFGHAQFLQNHLLLKVMPTEYELKLFWCGKDTPWISQERPSHVIFLLNPPMKRKYLLLFMLFNVRDHISLVDTFSLE